MMSHNPSVARMMNSNPDEAVHSDIISGVAISPDECPWCTFSDKHWHRHAGPRFARAEVLVKQTLAAVEVTGRHDFIGDR